MSLIAGRGCRWPPRRDSVSPCAPLSGGRDTHDGHENSPILVFFSNLLGVRASDTEPGSNLDLWLSGSAFHFWNPSQSAPATAWEARIDTLMTAQVATADAAQRKRLFDEVQQIFADYVPAIYFAAPRVVIATSPRVANARPALLKPYMLWSADTLAGASPQMLSIALNP